MCRYEVGKNVIFTKLSADLKGKADWENLITFGSVFESVGAAQEEEHWPY